MPSAWLKRLSHSDRLGPAVGSLAGFLIFLLLVHRIEIHRAEQELGKTPLGDQASDGLAQNREQNVRARGFEHHLLHFWTTALDGEDSCLLYFCQKHRLLFVTCGDGRFQRDFVNVLFSIDNVLLCLKVNFRFRAVVFPGKSLGTSGGLKGRVLDKDMV